jgi:hypothetical protein
MMVLVFTQLPNSRYVGQVNSCPGASFQSTVWRLYVNWENPNFQKPTYTKFWARQLCGSVARRVLLDVFDNERIDWGFP